MGQEFPPTCVQAQHVIQLHCQTRTRPALAHKVGEKPPRSPWPTSQPETTATHHTASHDLLPPLTNSKPIAQDMLSQYASCTCIEVSKPIQNPYIISSAEQRKLMTWSRVWALFPSTHSGIQPQAQGYRCWPKAACKKTQNEFRIFTTFSFYGFQFQSWSNPYDLTCHSGLTKAISTAFTETVIKSYMKAVELTEQHTSWAYLWLRPTLLRVSAEYNTKPGSPANPGYMFSSKRTLKLNVYSLYISILHVYKNHIIRSPVYVKQFLHYDSSFYFGQNPRSHGGGSDIVACAQISLLNNHLW